MRHGAQLLFAFGGVPILLWVDALGGAAVVLEVAGLIADEHFANRIIHVIPWLISFGALVALMLAFGRKGE